MAKFIANDANSTDGTDLSKMSAIYEVNGELVRIPADTAPGNVDAAIAAVIGVDQAAVVTMINTFTKGSAALTYFHNLQINLKTAAQNGTAINAIFTAMLPLLQAQPAALYTYYVNLLNQLTGIDQPTLEGGAMTTAQKRQAYQVAIMFANTGMIQTLFGTLFT